MVIGSYELKPTLNLKKPYKPKHIKNTGYNFSQNH
jgi:hypothetical protein